MKLAWLGCIKRLPNERMLFKILNDRIFDKRTYGRPRKRLIQCIEENLKTMRVFKWWEKILERDDGKRILREAKDCFRI